MREPYDRRGFLGWLGASAGALVVGAATPGCSTPPRGTRVPLARLEGLERLELQVGEQPVELRREEDGWIARSLLCTHMSCRLRWEAAAREYHCPCHKGRFDERGKVIDGPPLAPMTTLPVSVVGDELEIDG